MRSGRHFTLKVLRTAAALAIALTAVAPSGADDAAEEAPEASADSEGAVRVHYGDHGLEIETTDGRYRAWFTLRAQFRLGYPFESDPLAVGDLDVADSYGLDVNRARFKWGGHAFVPWLDYYTEYELARGTLLDLRFTVERFEAVQLRVGQWKPEYNRERRDSSGEQQFADRSIVNRPFTIDRQPGLMVLGHLFRGSDADSRYWLGAFTGGGRGSTNNEGSPMLLGRWQWNVLGRDLEFSQSDVERREEAAGSLAVAAVTNRSRFTRFDSDGGGELDGFPADVAERYETRQHVLEGAYQHRGLSLQGEYHRKEIEDRIDGSRDDFDGAYVQAGFFFHGVWPAFPRPLELALRAAVVDGEPVPTDAERRELTAVANWFFHGHRNKLTMDVSRLTVEERATAASRENGWRARLQWDVSL